MVDFTLSEEQVALQTTARDFINKEAKPLIAELDKKTDPEECTNLDLIKRVSELGFRTLAIPEKYGGMGVMETLTSVLVCEELAVGDISLASLPTNGRKIYHMFNDPNLMTEEMRDKWLKAYCADPTFLYAVAGTEPDSGSENFLPYDGVDGGIRTTAVREGDHYVINGMKHYISHAGIAKLYLVFARTDKTKPINEGATCFVIPDGVEGMTFGRVHDKLGFRLLRNQEIFFENCRIPVEWRMGQEGMALPSVRASIGSDGILNASRALGVSRAAFEAVVDFCKQRVQCGKPIIEHEVIASQLADMFIELYAMRSMVWRVAWAMDHPPTDPKLIPSTMTFCCDGAIRITSRAAEIPHGLGIMKEAPFEKFMRDAFCIKHLDGGSNIRRLRIGKLLESDTGGFF